MAFDLKDWQVTPEKITEAVHRIVEAADPIQIIAFGSRARGDHRPDSDLDIAVILDDPQETVYDLLGYELLRGLRMEVSLVVVSKSKYDLHRPWLNSVFNYINREGLILYDRADSKSSYPNAVRSGARRLVNNAVSAA